MRFISGHFIAVPGLVKGLRQWGAMTLVAASACFACSSVSARAQVFVVGREHVTGIPQFQPTNIPLSSQRLTARGHQDLISGLTAEQGFARRPLPLGAHGLLLHANGAMNPGNDDYEKTLERTGTSVKPGGRVVITDVRIEPKRIVFDFNGGPEKKHALLRHVSVGTGTAMMPLASDNGIEATGSRLTLIFDQDVPEISADQVKALIRPVLGFDVKTPLEVYTDTLPLKLKNAILSHQVLVGMDRRMVTYAVGAPERKVREQQGSTPFEEWIYGETPKPVQFVRFIDNRVTRIETAQFGESPTVRDQDETDGYLPNPHVHDVQVGDRQVAASGESTRAKAPSLRLPGEDLPQSPMQPVNMPDGKTASPQPIPAAPQAQNLASAQPAAH